jgi:hypothetical protein
MKPDATVSARARPAPKPDTAAPDPLLPALTNTVWNGVPPDETDTSSPPPLAADDEPLDALATGPPEVAPGAVPLWTLPVVGVDPSPVAPLTTPDTLDGNVDEGFVVPQAQATSVHPEATLNSRNHRKAVVIMWRSTEHTPKKIV